MKKIILASFIIISACIFSHVQAYAPLMFNYEGIARSDNGFPMDNSKLFLRITISEGDESKKILYQELQQVKTNSMGLFHTFIGEGKVEAGSMGYFAGGKNYNYLKIELVSIGETAGKINFECIKCGLKTRFQSLN
jgi:hypothetical protein